MLPVVICEPDEGVRAQWTELLGELIHREYPSIRMELLTGTETDLERALKKESGVMLVVLGVSEHMQNGVEGCIELFRQVMARNRDSYTLLCLHNGGSLDAVLSKCMRPAGILMLPMRDELARASLRRILNDYEALYGRKSEDSYLIINSGGTVRRIPYRDIVYMEAQNKLLRVCTFHQAIMVRASLNNLAETLPTEFIRCHRSYIINKAYLESFNSPEMTVRLTSHEQIPVSRPYKEIISNAIVEVSHL